MEYDDIVDCKASCDGKQYFDLFDKHIPMLKDGSAVLLYAISNLDCIVNIINKNPRSIYYICDTETIFDLLKLTNENTKFIYVENLDAIIEENMKFDCIVMNPPYSKNLHLKILAEAIKHLKDSGKIASLQPVVKWQEAFLFNEDKPVSGTTVLEMFSMDFVSKLFGIEQRCNLGIVSNNGNNTSLIDNFDLLYKIKIKLNHAISISGLLKDKLENGYKEFPIHFGVGATIAGHGGHGKACYRLMVLNEANATRKENPGCCKQFNAINKIEQHLVYKFYQNTLIRFIAKEFGFGRIPLKILPFVSGFVDENGKTPLDEEWSFEKLVKWFELDYNDLLVIRKSLYANLYQNELDEIDEVIEKYK